MQSPEVTAFATGDMVRALPSSVGVCVLALLILVPIYGNHGLWAGLVVLNATRTITLWRPDAEVPASATLG